LSTEGDVLLSVIGAYSDVLRDEQALAVRRQHLSMLSYQLDMVKAQRGAGELTITDVSQAEAQYATERSLVADAMNQLQADRAAYATVVGQNPVELAPEPPLPGVPASIDEAFALADESNPELQRARDTEEISRQQVIAAKAAFLPSVAIGGTAAYANASQPYFGIANVWNLSAQATVSEPLFTNGQRASAVREAVDQNTADRIAVEGARRTMVQHVADAWNQMISARTEVGLDEEASKAAGDAFKGMQIEFKAGERSTLDVLLAEQTMRNAEIALLAARRDEYVGAATVLRYIGRLRGEALVSDLPRYDPAAHLRSVKNRFMAPWTGLVQGFDGVLSPGERPGAIPRPPVAANPSMAAPTAPVPADAPLATALPTTPAAAVRK
ncbi:MAG: TolC family protein, partial [Caulobacteraceae bacterium]